MSHQLDMFTRRPARTLPDPIERKLHLAVAKTIMVAKDPRWVVFHSANGEKRDPKTAALLKGMLVIPGVSDLMCLGPGPAVCALELKRRPNKPTPEQLDFLDFVAGIGGKAAWTDSYDEAIRILVAWGVLIDRIRVSA